MRKIIILLIVLSLFLISGNEAEAGCCGCDPIFDQVATVEVVSAVWLRDIACTETGEVIDTMKVGEVVQTTHTSGGWYKFTSPRGKTGWAYSTFFKNTSKTPTSSSTPTTPEPTNTNTTDTVDQVTNPTYSSSSLAWLKGYILLQVQELGEAWYVDPTTFKRFYMKDGATAYEMMRSFGLGITDADLAKIPKDTDNFEGDLALRKRLSGKILLQVQQNGEAWYIYPKTLKRHYLRDGAAAYEIMRFLGLGITNSDLSRLSSSELTVKPYTTTESSTTNTSTNTTTSSLGLTLLPASTDHADGPRYTSYGSAIAGTGQFQKGSMPLGFSYAELNQYVLDRINRERTQRGMPAIISDQRMVDTASVWAEQMYIQQQMTHTRQPVNMMARVWVWENFEIEFRETWGWLYENIGGGNYNRSSGINESVKSSMDSLFDFYMSEESYNGIHFQTIMHDKLTHVGIGFYFEGSNDSGKLWTVLHYGGLYGQVLVK